MLMDAAELPAGTSLRAGICLVGGGAAGIAMALDLAAAGRDVLVLEAGGPDRTEAAQREYQGTVVDEALHGPLDTFRLRRLGGTTGVWNGRCVPYDPIDFEPRPAIAHSGWPVTYDEVARYFPAANRFLEAGGADYSASSTFGPAQPEMIEGFGSELFSTDRMERFSPPTDVGRRYRTRLANSGRIRVVLHAPLAEIVLSESGETVSSLVVRRPDRTTFPIYADRVVLAAGGMETVRLLLANRAVQRDGIGNAHGVVGRYYMAHIAGTIGQFRPAGRLFNGYQVADDGVYCRRRLALTAAAQRRHGVGNFIARLHHTRISDPVHGSGVLSALRLARGLVPRQWRARLVDEPNTAREMAHHGWNVARDLPAVAGFARQLVFDRKLAERQYPSVVVEPRSRVYSLDFHSEQEPNPTSVVRLGDDRDEHGMPRLVVDWRYSPRDVKTVEVALELFTAEVARCGAGTFRFDPATVLTEIRRYGAYGGHHLGTARMGTDPATSVVDANCRIHGMSNLYLAGGAVFPTSSQANPTLTVVALALRLSDHLKATA